MNEARASDPATFVESAWRDQARWSEVAGRLKSSLDRWRLAAACAGAIGALLATAAGTIAGLQADPADPWAVRWGAELDLARRSSAALAALLLALVPYVLKARVSADQVRAWNRARAASEALKETIYRWLLGAPPFAAAPSPADLVRRCQAIKQGLADLGAVAAAVEAPPKARPASLDPDGYVAERVNAQVDGYYLKKSRTNALAAARLRGLEFALSLAATALGAVAGLAEPMKIGWLGLLGPWAAVATTIAGAVTSHLAASRYDQQATLYFATAERLRGLRDEWLATPDRLAPKAVAAFVDQCERTISAENQAWVAEWSAAKADG
jgi:hypothetical protein